MRVLVGNRYGVIIAELSPLVGEITWLLNDVGKVRLTFSTRDPKTLEIYICPGNRVKIEFDNGLPPRGGVMDPPIIWGPGTVSIDVYTILYSLKSRLTEKNDDFYEWQVGEIFQWVLERTQQKGPLGITYGEIWKGGNPHYPRYNYKTLWYVLDYSLRGLETCDFDFVPYIEDSVIKFQANFTQVAGSDKTSEVTFSEGSNVAHDFILEEQGPIINSHYAVAEGSVWDETRTVIIGNVQASIAKYGLRESRVIYAKISMPAALELYARKVLKENAYPRKIFQLSVTNNEPGTFASYDLGDVVGCKLPSYLFGGFDENVRVLGREYDPQSGECKLVVEQPRDLQYWFIEEEASLEE